MNNYFIILAAGSSKRFNTKKSKQYFNYKNKKSEKIDIRTEGIRVNNEK